MQPEVGRIQNQKRPTPEPVSMIFDRRDGTGASGETQRVAVGTGA
jgi:hypothetical protein